MERFCFGPRWEQRWAQGERHSGRRETHPPWRGRISVNLRSWTSLRCIVTGLLLPLMLLGLYVLAMEVYSLWRYDPAYFSIEYAQKYSTPGSTVKAIEAALQTGDRALMSELEGRRAAPLVTMPKWRAVFGPVAGAWWAGELLIVLAVSLYRLSARRRAENQDL
jgi:hypothetical protein